MKIQKIVSQNRRDFIAIYECEHCTHTIKSSGYDDSYFHVQVIPNMPCVKCGKKSPKDYKALSTKYDDYTQV